MIGLVYNNFYIPGFCTRGIWLLWSCHHHDKYFLVFAGWMADPVCFPLCKCFFDSNKSAFFLLHFFHAVAVYKCGCFSCRICGHISSINPGREKYLTELLVLGLIMFVTFNTNQVLTSLLAATRKKQSCIFSFPSSLCP